MLYVYIIRIRAKVREKLLKRLGEKSTGAVKRHMTVCNGYSDFKCTKFTLVCLYFVFMHLSLCRVGPIYIVSNHHRKRLTHNPRS